MMLSSQQRECPESAEAESRAKSPAPSPDPIRQIHDYWKNFDIKQLKHELNEQMEAIERRQAEYESLSGKFEEASRSLGPNETVTPLLDALHHEIDGLSRRCNINETCIVRLFKLITNVPDPLPAIDLAKALNASDIYEQIRSLQSENRELKQAIQRYRDECGLKENKPNEDDKELICQLSDQVAKTTQMNLELASRLTLSENELEGYKKLLIDYQSELTETRLKQLRAPSPTTKDPTNSSENGKFAKTKLVVRPGQLKELLKPKVVNIENTFECANLDNTSEFDNEETEGEVSWSPRSSCKSPGACELINTAEIAAKVRDLLNAHNIGQRVFAKIVLGLSQGTVSELLSKPKHWEKLTEKGRDSYRKMYLWACNEQSIASVKAMSPRKGHKESYLGYGGGKEDSATEERIVQILNEAQRAMRGAGEQHAANDSGHHSSSSPSCSARSSLSPSMSPNESKASRKFEDEESGNEEEEESETAVRDSEDEVEAKAQPKRFSDDACCPLDLTVKPTPRTASNTGLVVTPPKKARHDLDSSEEPSAVQLSAFARQQPVVKSEPKVLSSSPLRHIQSIADAYLQHKHGNSPPFQRPASTPSPSLPSASHKPLKCILPPVSQEQFDKYSFINTDDLVKRVKDLLSKFSISQRLFGECILNLSQGSVSDLLARPKPWMMLTQKGREPFIRMQMFIEEPDAVKKLMVNQYKPPGSVSVDKTVRDSSNGSAILTPKPVLGALSAPVSRKSPTLVLSNEATKTRATFIELQPKTEPVNENSNDSELRLLHQQPQINIIPYDISSLSAVGELNTEEVTNRVKETLLNNNIGQKLFGEAVLNLSQGTVSELLSKPKPWNTLSIKGREPYLRMYMWLNDAARLDKLSEWKEEKSCKNLMKRSVADLEPDQQKPKRRFIFSEEQKDQLMLAFKYDPYPAVNQMETLAQKLGLQTRTVINWFHNHRMRIRYKSSAAAAASSFKASAAAANEGFYSGAANNLCSLISARSRFGQFAELGSKLEAFPFASLLGAGGFSLSGAYENNRQMTLANYASSKNGDDAYEEEDDESGEMEMEDDDDEQMEETVGADDESNDNDEVIDQTEINSMYLDNNDSENIENENETGYWGHSNADDEARMKLSEQKTNKRRKPHNPQKLSLALNQMNNAQQNWPKTDVALPSAPAPDGSADEALWPFRREPSNEFFMKQFSSNVAH